MTAARGRTSAPTPLVVVSPHLDDAVLSVGAALAARVDAGGDVVVVTVCSRVDDGGVRAAEDAASLATLGARGVHLGLPDAPLRGVPCTHDALCAADVDDALAAAAADALGPWCAGAEVWAPLGCGGHVDHRLCHAAARSLRGASTTAEGAAAGWAFYEDRPYARAPGVVAARWRALGAAVFDAVDADDDVDERVAFYCAVLPGRRAVLPGRRPATPGRLPARVRHGDEAWLRQRLVVDDEPRARRGRAMACHASQRALLFGDGDPHPVAATDVARRGWPWTDRHEALWRQEDR